MTTLSIVGSILRFSLIKECLYFHTCFVRQKSPKTLATIGTLYSTCTMDGGEHTSFFDYFPWPFLKQTLKNLQFDNLFYLLHNKFLPSGPDHVLITTGWRWIIFVFNASVFSKSGQAKYRRRRREAGRLQCSFEFCIQYRVFYPLSLFNCSLFKTCLL